MARRRRMPKRGAGGRFVKRARASAAEAPRRRRRRRHAAAANPTPRRHRRRRSYAAAPRRRRHRVRGYSYSRGGRRVRVRGHMSHEKLPGGNVRVRRHRVSIHKRNVPTRGYTRHYTRKQYTRGPYVYRRSAEELAALENPIGYAMENPLSMGEMVVMGIMGAVGFGLGSLVDRMICSNPVTVNAQNQLIETPGAGAVYNVDAVNAPMGITRWAAGLGVPLVLGWSAGFIGGPWTKVVLQGTAVGWGIRTLGKGIDDLMAYLLGGKAGTAGSGRYGAQWYAPEIHAINAVKAVGTSTLPPLTQGSYSLNTPSVQTLQGIPAIMQRQPQPQYARPAPQQRTVAAPPPAPPPAKQETVEPKRLPEPVQTVAAPPAKQPEPAPAAAPGFFRRSPAGSRWPAEEQAA